MHPMLCISIKIGHVPDYGSKMFGTFQPELPVEKYQPIRYGLTKPLQSENPVHLVSHEWVDIARDVLSPACAGKKGWDICLGPRVES